MLYTEHWFVHQLYPLSTQLLFFSLRNLYTYWSFVSFTWSIFCLSLKKKAKLETSERSRFNDLSFKFVSRPQFIKHLPFGALLYWHGSDKSWIITIKWLLLFLSEEDTENSISYTWCFFVKRNEMMVVYRKYSNYDHPCLINLANGRQKRRRRVALKRLLKAVLMAL